MSDVKYPNGRSITLFLMDGNADGRYCVELPTGTIRAYKIPRTMIMESCKYIEDLNTPAVYFLLGANSSEESHKPYTVYIGETETPKERFKARLGNKDWFTETVVVVSSNSFFNKAHVKYLESKFMQIANETGRYDVSSGKESIASKLSDADISNLQSVIRDTKLLLSALGHKFLELRIQSGNITEFNGTMLPQTSTTLSLIINQGETDAKAIVTSDGFVVLKGSKVKPTVSPKAERVKNLRKKYADLINPNFCLTDNIIFNSASTSASFVNGYIVNGYDKSGGWKGINGETLRELETGEFDAD